MPEVTDTDFGEFELAERSWAGTVPKGWRFRAGPPEPARRAAARPARSGHRRDAHDVVVRALVLLLTWKAARRGRLRLQTLERDVDAAVDAFAVLAAGHALLGGGDLAQLVDVALLLGGDDRLRGCAARRSSPRSSTWLCGCLLGAWVSCASSASTSSSSSARRR